ncbi:MAG: hypothetical protein OXT49_02995 [Gammaproteobacteria bacterium]|nr:hypothetical protein [Gammaproteobacteria bacterium]
MRSYFTVLVVTLLTACGAETDTAAEENATLMATPEQQTCPPREGAAEDMVCAAVYDPVCAFTPQGPQTFSNSCKACLEDGVGHYKKGACEDA